MKDDHEKKAWNHLQNALQIVLACDVDADLRDTIQSALFHFDYEGKDSSPKGAVEALKHAKRALWMCEFWELLYDELDAAEKTVRDSLTIRTQLHALPIGIRATYKKTLREAYGGYIDVEDYSQLMQSYRKVMWMNFESAFVSKNHRENNARGGARPRRERIGRRYQPRHV